VIFHRYPPVSIFSSTTVRVTPTGAARDTEVIALMRSTASGVSAAGARRAIVTLIKSLLRETTGLI
jgi:hypothetical protein